jgi:hypothetical protein
MNDTPIKAENELMEPVHTESIANGPILVLLVILLIAILGGMYRWFVLLDNDIPAIPAGLRPSALENNEPESTSAEARAEAMGVVSTSNEIPAIEADIESTELDSLESELNAIEAELDAALDEAPTEPTPESAPADPVPSEPPTSQ